MVFELLDSSTNANYHAEVENNSEVVPDSSCSSIEELGTKLSVSSRFDTTKDDKDTILVYPCDLLTDQVTDRVRRRLELTELGGSLLGVEGATDAPNEHYLSRKKNVSIVKESEMWRLESNKMLNDDQINFTFQWMLRSECPSAGNILSLSSHFLPRLIKGDDVQRFTFRDGAKNIDVFKKKLIFIPYNHDLHWSLVVIVNPGNIGNYYSKSPVMSDDEVPMIICMDSLGNYHDKSIPTKALRKWLNSEWERLRGDVTLNVKENNKRIFQRKSIPMIELKVPRQSCSARCGVYTVRFGYNMYVMRNTKFTAAFSRNNCRDISSSPAFDFGDSDMDRFRAEINALIRGLSREYLTLLKGATNDGDNGSNNGSKNSSEGGKGNSSKGGDDDEDSSDDSSGNHKPGPGQGYSSVRRSLNSPSNPLGEDDNRYSKKDMEIGGVLPARLRPELNRLEDNASSDEDEDEKTRFLQKRLIALRETVTGKIPKKKGGCRKFKMQKVHRLGKLPMCRGCNEPIQRGDDEFDQSWHMVTGNQHYHHYCIGNLTREERWKIFEMARSLVKHGDMDQLTYENLSEQMQVAEAFPDFMSSPEYSENDEYEHSSS